jgi:hypothetical protein
MYTTSTNSNSVFVIGSIVPIAEDGLDQTVDWCNSAFRRPWWY